jgi:Phosphoesterase family
LSRGCPYSEPIFQGGLQTGYYNMAEGDAPIVKKLAERYSVSDNYHQAVQGGTGASHIALGTGFAASYQDANGHAATPPAGEIENPDPKPGTNNNYTQDGYGSSTVPEHGGSYSECADQSQPGVGAVDRLQILAVANGVMKGEGRRVGPRKAEEESIAELLAAAAARRGARMGDVRQAEDLPDTP